MVRGIFRSRNVLDEARPTITGMDFPTLEIPPHLQPTKGCSQAHLASNGVHYLTISYCITLSQSLFSHEREGEQMRAGVVGTLGLTQIELTFGISI